MLAFRVRERRARGKLPSKRIAQGRTGGRTLIGSVEVRVAVHLHGRGHAPLVVVVVVVAARFRHVGWRQSRASKGSQQLRRGTGAGMSGCAWRALVAVRRQRLFSIEAAELLFADERLVC